MPGSFVGFSCEALTLVEQKAQGAQLRLKVKASADALEWLLDLGVLGLLPRLGLAALALWAALRRPGRTGLALAATLSSLLARSAVDFPFARHAEVTLWVLLCAAAFSPRRTP